MKKLNFGIEALIQVLKIWSDLMDRCVIFHLRKHGISGAEIMFHLSISHEACVFPVLGLVA